MPRVLPLGTLAAMRQSLLNQVAQAAPRAQGGLGVAQQAPLRGIAVAARAARQAPLAQVARLPVAQVQTQRQQAQVQQAQAQAQTQVQQARAQQQTPQEQIGQLLDILA